jgi:hypothetical protein
VTPATLAALIGRMADGTVSNNGARQVFDALWSGEGTSVDAVIEAKGLKQMNDSGALEAIVDAVIAANEKSVEEYRAGKDKAFNALVGQVMKASKGKANPAQAGELLRRKLAEGAPGGRPGWRPWAAGVGAAAPASRVRPGPQPAQAVELGVVEAVDAVQFGFLVGLAALRRHGGIVGVERRLQLGRQRPALVELGLVAQRLALGGQFASGAARWPSWPAARCPARLRGPGGLASSG